MRSTKVCNADIGTVHQTSVAHLQNAVVIDRADVAEAGGACFDFFIKKNVFFFPVFCLCRAGKNQLKTNVRVLLLQPQDGQRRKGVKPKRTAGAEYAGSRKNTVFRFFHQKSAEFFLVILRQLPVPGKTNSHR